jgi:predicted DNA-binding protein (MmcQ/YjbR family)
MITHEELNEYLLSFPGAWLDYPFGEETAVYKIGHKGQPGPNEKMFALVSENSKPLRVSFKTDPFLNKTLQERYETVLPGYHLNKKHWLTVICSGQLTDDEIHDLARLSYNLVTENKVY